MILFPLVALILVGLVALGIASWRPTAPLRSGVGRTIVLVLAGLGLLLAMVASQLDFWFYTEAESEITAQYVVGAGDRANGVAVVAVLASAIIVVLATFGRRSFAGLAVAVSWLTVLVVWLAYLIDDDSSRSSAELGNGPSVLTAALTLLTLAVAARWLVARRQQGPAAPDAGRSGLGPQHPAPAPTDG